MFRTLIGLGVASGVAACAGLARAEGPAQSLAGGHLIISADRVAPLLTYDSAAVTQNGSPVTATAKVVSIGFATNGRNGPLYLTPRLALDGVIAHFTFGGSVWVSTQASYTVDTVDTSVGGMSMSQDQAKTTYWGIAPRVGYILPAGDFVAFWPRVGIEYHSASTSSGPNALGGTTPGSSGNEVAVDLEANFVVTPWNHFGLLFSSFAAVPIGGNVDPGGGAQSLNISELVVGLTVGLLGYF